MSDGEGNFGFPSEIVLPPHEAAEMLLEIEIRRKIETAVEIFLLEGISRKKNIIKGLLGARHFPESDRKNRKADAES